MKKKSEKLTFVWRFLKGNVGLFVAAVFCSMLNTVWNSATPQIIRITVDSIIGDAPTGLPAVLDGWLGLAGLTLLQGLLLAGAAVLVTTALGGLCDFFSRMGTAYCSEGFVKRLRDTLFGHIQKLPFQWHTEHQTGEMIQRCTSDVEVIRSFVTNQFLEVFRILFLIIFSFVVMFSMNVTVSLVALAFVPIIVGASVLFYSKIATRFLKADEAEGELTTNVQENLTGVRVVRAFGREQWELERFEEKNNAFAGLWIKLGRLLSIYWASGDLITGVQILAVLTVGVVQTVNGQITPGEFLAFNSYNAAMVWPVRALGRVLSEMSKAGVSIDRVKEILDEREETQPSNPQRPDMKGDIVFDHVTFTYPGEVPVLQDVSFTIPAGTTFAILGGTGSGKSTLVHLLDRLYDLAPGGGKILVNGVDITEIPRDYLRAHIGMVLQEPFLYSRTVEENIKVTRPTAQRDQVRQAAATACVDEALAEMRLGYDTVVGERGVTLSGGQKQRVAIARMLMSEAPIMVFDDSLAAVDTETDAKIRAALKGYKEKVTTILISHRVVTLMGADMILVLDKGCVSQMGTHSQLLEQAGMYRRVYDLQMSTADRALVEGGDFHGL